MQKDFQGLREPGPPLPARPLTVPPTQRRGWFRFLTPWFPPPRFFKVYLTMARNSEQDQRNICARVPPVLAEGAARIGLGTKKGVISQHWFFRKRQKSI